MWNWPVGARSGLKHRLLKSSPSDENELNRPLCGGFARTSSGSRPEPVVSSFAMSDVGLRDGDPLLSHERAALPDLGALVEAPGMIPTFDSTSSPDGSGAAADGGRSRRKTPSSPANWVRASRRTSFAPRSVLSLRVHDHFGRLRRISYALSKRTRPLRAEHPCSSPRSADCVRLDQNNPWRSVVEAHGPRRSCLRQSSILLALHVRRPGQRTFSRLRSREQKNTGRPFTQLDSRCPTNVRPPIWDGPRMLPTSTGFDAGGTRIRTRALGRVSPTETRSGGDKRKGFRGGRWCGGRLRRFISPDARRDHARPRSHRGRKSLSAQGHGLLAQDDVLAGLGAAADQRTRDWSMIGKANVDRVERVFRCAGPSVRNRRTTHVSANRWSRFDRTAALGHVPRDEAPTIDRLGTALWANAWQHGVLRDVARDTTTAKRRGGRVERERRSARSGGSVGRCGFVRRGMKGKKMATDREDTTPRDRHAISTPGAAAPHPPRRARRRNKELSSRARPDSRTLVGCRACTRLRGRIYTRTRLKMLRRNWTVRVACFPALWLEVRAVADRLCWRRIAVGRRPDR
jgi:hypothetical protein